MCNPALPQTMYKEMVESRMEDFTAAGGYTILKEITDQLRERFSSDASELGPQKRPSLEAFWRCVNRCSDLNQ